MWPTHQPLTNAIVARNRRIGVGIIDFTGWVHDQGLSRVIKYLRKGYKVVSKINKILSAQAGVPESIKKTTIKPGGTVPKLAGRTPGCGYPTFDYTLRRMRVGADAPVVPIFKNANVPFVVDDFDKNTLIFEFPMFQGPSKAAVKVSLWEQALNLATLQREWSDNAVSNTLYFKPKWKLIEVFNDTQRLINYGLSPEQLINGKFKSGERKFVAQFNTSGEIQSIQHFVYDPNHEEDVIESVLAHIAPLIKSCSLLPHSEKGVYRNMPEEGITKEEYLRRRSELLPFDWTAYANGDGIDEKFCEGPSCEVPIK